MRVKVIRVNTGRILLYCLVIWCGALNFFIYNQRGDIETLSLRLDQNIKALNGWTYLIDENTLTLDKYEVIFLSQNGFNNSAYQQILYLTLRVYALEEIITKEFEEEEFKIPKERREIVGNIYNLREGQLPILRSCEKAIGFQEARIY